MDRRPLSNRVDAAAAVFRAERVIKLKLTAALAPLELAPDRYQVLNLLADAEGGKLALSEVSRALLIHPATTTYAMDTLEKRGLVKRQSDPRDRRGVLAHITPAGRALVRTAAELLEQIDWGVSELSDKEAGTVARTLSLLRPH